ncbi:hypothetical protein DL95DRAFT_462101 [Leptodontidium sp. 2 PMI_412]|nr:hypothetical protein DL95DRAFT_462101 [Leptodontidium sp. 2 PMI_412]
MIFQEHFSFLRTILLTFCLSSKRTFTLTAQDFLDFQKIPPTNRISSTQSESAVPDHLLQASLRALSPSPPPSRQPVTNPTLNLGLSCLEQLVRDAISPALHWLRARAQEHLPQRAREDIFTAFQSLVVETTRRLRAIAEGIFSGLLVVFWSFLSGIQSPIGFASSILSHLANSTWLIWFFRGFCRIIIHHATVVYVCVAIFYTVFGGYRDYFSPIPGVGHIAETISAPLFLLTCRVPGVRWVDELAYSLCPPPPHVFPTTAHEVTSQLPLRETDTTKVLYQFTNLSTPSFWTDSLRISGHLADLGTSFKGLRLPYQKLHANWKYTVSPVLRARRAPAIQPLVMVVEAIDASADELIIFQSELVSAWMRVETSLEYFRQKLAAAKASWLPSLFSSPSSYLSSSLGWAWKNVAGRNGMKANKLIIDYYAHQCEVFIQQITVLINRIEANIRLISQTEMALENLRSALQAVETERLEDLVKQRSWTTAWWTKKSSSFPVPFADPRTTTNNEKAVSVKGSYYHETLKISAIMAVNDETMAELSTLLEFLTMKRTQWNEFRSALFAHPGSDQDGHSDGLGGDGCGSGCKDGEEAANCRERHREGDEIDLELHLKLVDELLDEHKRLSHGAWSKVLKWGRDGNEGDAAGARGRGRGRGPGPGIEDA